MMQLRDVMTRDVEVIGAERTLVEAARKMKDLDGGPIAVCDDKQIIGMITDRDIATRAVAEGRDPRQTQVRDVMTQDVVYCFEDDDVKQAARLMQQRQVRRLLVLNQQRELAGIVSLGDLAVDSGDQHLISKTLEQASVDPDAPPAKVRHRARYDDPADAAPAAGHEAQSTRGRIGPETHAEAVHVQSRDRTGRQTIAGLFPDRQSAERAIDDLKQAGFSRDQIGMVMRDRDEGLRGSERPKERHAAEGAVTGLLGGGVLGGMAGYLVAIGALTIPGIGPVVAGGALVEALGVVAGTAAVGAGIGAAAGGLVGVLVGMGIPEEEARHFERGFGAQEALVTVKAGVRVAEALAIMEMNNADT